MFSDPLVPCSTFHAAPQVTFLKYGFDYITPLSRALGGSALLAGQSPQPLGGMLSLGQPSQPQTHATHTPYFTIVVLDYFPCLQTADHAAPPLEVSNHMYKATLTYYPSSG